MSDTVIDRTSESEDKKSDFSLGLTFRLNGERHELNITGARTGKPSLISRAKNAAESRVKEIVSNRKESRRLRREAPVIEKEDVGIKAADGEDDAVQENSDGRSRAGLVAVVTAVLAFLALAAAAVIVFFRCMKYVKKVKSVVDAVRAFRKRRRK